MKAMLIKDVPDDLNRLFRIRCLEMGISMKEGILRLMGLVNEERILFSPIEQEKKALLKYSDKMVRSSDYQKK